MVAISVASAQQDLAWLRNQSGDLAVSVFELQEGGVRPRTRVWRAEESGHVENADGFGGGPLLNQLQRAAEAPERGHEPVVTETLVVGVAVPDTHRSGSPVQD